MNFFNDGKLLIKDDQYYVNMFGKEFKLSESKQSLLKAKDQPECDVIVGVRPEDVEVTNSDPNGVLAKIDVYELMGSEVYLHVKAQGNQGSEQEAVLRVKSFLVNEDMKSIEIVPVSHAIHVFDKDTGLNITNSTSNVPHSTLEEAVNNQ
jgi:multiple sugar transport system ATP-binding protein